MRIAHAAPVRSVHDVEHVRGKLQACEPWASCNYRPCAFRITTPQSADEWMVVSCVPYAYTCTMRIV